MKTVLISDNDKSVHEQLTPLFQKEHIHVVSRYDAKSTREYMRNFQVDLLILNTELPDKNGISVIRHIRTHNKVVPIIIVSALDGEVDRVVSLEMGADDYVVKPFYPREVVIRTQKLISRVRADSSAGKQTFQNLKINTETLECKIEAEPVEFTALEIKFLAYLAANPKKVLQRNQILHAVWEYQYEVDTRAVDAVVKRVRRKLAQYPCTFEIQTVYGAGYRMVATL